MLSHIHSHHLLLFSVDDVNVKVKELTEHVDLSQIIPIKKQQGCVTWSSHRC